MFHFKKNYKIILSTALLVSISSALYLSRQAIWRDKYSSISAKIASFKQSQLDKIIAEYHERAEDRKKKIIEHPVSNEERLLNFKIIIENLEDKIDTIKNTSNNMKMIENLEIDLNKIKEKRDATEAIEKNKSQAIVNKTDQSSDKESSQTNSESLEGEFQKQQKESLGKIVSNPKSPEDVLANMKIGKKYFEDRIDFIKKTSNNSDLIAKIQAELEKMENKEKEIEQKMSVSRKKQEEKNDSKNPGSAADRLVNLKSSIERMEDRINLEKNKPSQSKSLGKMKETLARMKEIKEKYEKRLENNDQNIQK